MKPLPSYARKVEYLESTGTQWINTELGYFPDFEIGCKMRESAGNVTIGVNQAWAFSRHSAADPTWKLVANSRTLKTSVPVTSYVDASYKNGSFVANSSVIASEPNQFVSGDMLVFTRGSNLPTSYPAVLYYLKCYDWNGNLVRDFKPCRINGIGYLWDEVEGRFYENKGTGNFVLGKDVREGVIPTRLNPMGVARRLDPVPFDAEVEYLESTGTQWISTPVKISSFGRLEVDASFTTWAGAADTLWCARKIIASSNIQNSFALFKLANGTLGWDVRPNGSTNRITVNFAGDTNKHNYRQAGNALYIDGTQVATTTATISESGGPLYLFVSNFVNDEMTNPASGRLYKAEYFDENGNLVMQLVPVRKDGVGYLFDRVSGQLFGNAGTGAFVYGGDK